jgi:hypothetical protein
MLRRKRLLKKEQNKHWLKLTVMLFIVLLIILCGLGFVYLNFGKVSLISPLAQNKASKIAVVEELFSKDKIGLANITSSSDGSFVANLASGEEVILSSKKDIGSQLSSLQLILSRLTIEGKKLKVLDFRFDNPVVTF